MSNTIDQRIVQMKFDNAQFESGVRESMNSLNKFDKSIQEASKGTGFSSLTKSIEGISSSFNAMTVVGITALARLTNSAITAGKKMVSALTIDPLKSGFAEYQEQMDSTMVIMSNTGDSLATVTDALDELNVYADKTVYSFGQMTNAIGKFAAAGVNLDDSVAAIKGLSNAAALVGAQGPQLASAYYNLSQSLQMGYLQTIDYNSLANSTIFNKNMRDIMVETAIEMGKFTKDSEMARLATENFKDSLQKKWLTSDVILAALEKYSTTETEIGKRATEAATELRSFKQLIDTVLESIGTGWADTWKFVFGDLEEAKKLWTAVGEVITSFTDSMSKDRNEVLKWWKAFGGRQQLIDSLFNSIDALKSVLKPVSEAFRQLFPKANWWNLLEMTKNLKEFTKGLKLTEDQAEGLRKVFVALFVPLKLFVNVLMLGGQAIAFIAGKVDNFVRKILTMVSSTDNFNKAMTELLYKIRDVFGQERYIRLMTAWRTIVDSVSKSVAVLKEQWKDFKDQIKSSESINKLFNSISKGSEGIKGGALDIIVAIFEKLANILSRIDFNKFNVFDILAKGIETLASAANILVNAFNGIFSFATNLTTGLLDLASAGNVLNVIFGAVLAKSLWKVANGAHGFWNAFFGIGEMLDDLGDTIEGVKWSVKGFAFQEISAGIKNIAISIGILALSLAVINSLDHDKLIGTLIAFKTIINTLTASIAGIMILTKVLTNSKNALGSFFKTLELNMTLTTVGNSMIKLAGSILVLVAAMKLMAMMEVNGELESGLIGIAGAIGILLGSLALMTKIAPQIKTGVSSLLMLAAAVGILVPSIKALSGMNFLTEFLPGLVHATIAMAALGAVAAALTKIAPNLFSGGLALIFMAGAVRILVPAIQSLGNLDILEDIVPALVAMAGAMLTLGLTAGLLSKFSPLAITGAASMLVMATAVRVLVPALSALADLCKSDEIVYGLLSLIVAMGTLGLTAGLLGKFSPLAITGAASILVLALAVNLLVPALSGLSRIVEGGHMMDSLLSMAAAVGTLGLVAGALGTFAPMAILGAASILVLSAALMVLTPSLLSLVNANALDIVATLAALSGGLLLLGAVTGILGIVSPLILAFSVSLGALGISCAILSPALLALSQVKLDNLSTDIFSLATALSYLSLTSVGMIAVGAGALVASAGLGALALAIIGLNAAIIAATALASLFDAGHKFINDFIDGYKSEDVEVLGENTASGLAGGIQKAFGKLKAIGKGLANAVKEGFCGRDAMDIHSPSKLMEKIGEWITKGLGNGIVGGEGEVFNIMDLFAKDTADKYTDSYTREMEMESNKISTAISSGITKAAKDNEQFFLDSGLHSGQEWAYGVIKAIEDSGYIIADAEKAAILSGEVYADVTSFESDFNTNKLDETRYTRAASALDSLGSAAGGAGKSASEAKDAFKDMRDSIASSIDVFKEFTEAETVSADKLLANMASQIRGTEQWANSFEQLAAKGFDEAIIKKLADMGTESYGYIKGMLTMSDTYVQAYNRMFKYTEQIADSSVEKIKIALPEMTKTVAEETKKTVEQVGKDTDKVDDKVETALDDIRLSLDETTDSVEDTNKATLILVNSAGEMAEVSEEEAEAILKAAEATDLQYGLYGDLKTAMKDVENGTIRFAKTLDDQVASEENVITVTKDMVLAYIEATSKMNEAIEEWKTNLKDTISGSVNIFEKFDFTAEKSAQDYVDSIETQVNAMGFFADGLNQLLAKGFDERYVNEIAQKGVDGSFEIIAALKNATEEQKDRVNAAYQKTLDLPDTMVNGLAESFKDAGMWTVEGFATGLTENQKEIKDAFDLISTYGLENFLTFWGIHSPSTLMYEKGMFMEQGLANGITAFQALPQTAATNMALLTNMAVVDVLNFDKFKTIGQHIGDGLIAGIESKIGDVESAARALAEAANEAFRATLEINSPSRVFAESGRFIDEGLANGIKNSTHLVTDATETMGDSTIDTMADTLRRISEVINSDIDADPVIRPVLDLSEIQNGSDLLDNMLNKSTSIAARKAGEVAVSYAAAKEASTVGTTAESASGATYNFTQNNYSPKALDRIEIYRQTNNQFSKMKGLVNA